MMRKNSRNSGREGLHRAANFLLEMSILMADFLVWQQSRQWDFQGNQACQSQENVYGKELRLGGEILSP